MRYIAIVLLLLVAGCQEQTLRKAGNVHNVEHIIWTVEHTQLFVAMGTDCQVMNLPYENIELEKE